MRIVQRVLGLSALLWLIILTAPTWAQDTLTGAFEGTVTNSLTGDAIAGATAEITNVETGITFTKRTDAQGRFYQGLLPPGVYRIRISQPGYEQREVLQRLNIARTGEIVPVPVSLDPATATPTTAIRPPQQQPPGQPPTQPAAQPATKPPVPTPAPPVVAPATGSPAPTATTIIRGGINTLDARLSNSFTENDVTQLPLGAITLTRSFDELALLLPGVAPAPQTLGSVAGPGQGAGVGTAGQFSVNGLRSRANNFTVDGSDNNDEDIGVRRQGFTSLVPQPLESIKEYQAITLLAPAQFGRNLGAQVNAVSKSGGSQLHGNVYGFFNSSQLNARNAFDTAFGNATTALRTASGQAVLLDGQPLTVRNQSGGEDSFTLGKAGFVLGGPLKRGQTFYFLSGEGQRINARQEASFVVPTVEQRGAFRTGASGIFSNPFTGAPVAATPTSGNGDLVFSFFPFPNNPQGVYGGNTFTQSLPASARGAVLSAKLDHNFKWADRPQSLTGRYNFTNDRRQLPVTGEALFSSLQPRVRTQNFSFFFNSQLRAPDITQQVFNQLRLSYGRTRLQFDEIRDTQHLLPSTFANLSFLLNVPLLENLTQPREAGTPNTGAVNYARSAVTAEALGGPFGQISVAGFSPIGVDVFNFPQRRVNNTYQLADVLTARAGNHNLAFGADNRRTELNSDLPRIFRPLATFNGAPRLVFENGRFTAPAANAPNQFIRPEDLAAMGAASNFFLTLANGRNDAHLNLRFFQINLFAQDDWHIRRTLTLSYGVRYEYNTPPREINQQIERTFTDPALTLRGVEGLRQFIGNRTQLFTAERGNLAPRLSLAYAPQWFGKDRATVLRAGFGIYYDQILGAVASQSRNVFPTFLTVNFGGLFAFPEENVLTFINPARARLVERFRLVTQGTVNQLNPENPLNQTLLDAINQRFPNAISATLPTERLATPESYQYSFSFEQQLGQALAVSAAYVGTQGRHLLRFTTPNLGSATNVVPTTFTAVPLSGGLATPQVRGRICSPAPASKGLCQPGRVVSGVGAVNLFETSANSRYNALQLQLRARLSQALQLQTAYTLSSAQDDVSDVFDLAGAFSLPQNSLSLAGERGPANFDARQRFTYFLTYDLSALSRHWLWQGLQIASLGRLQTGQPFTVNSLFDVNLDGNLTDRLQSADGLTVTGDRRQPLRVTTQNLAALLAPVGQDGRIGRNSFRAGGLVEINLSVSKAFNLFRQQRLLLRADMFNLFNRANYGVPVRLLEAPGFGQSVNSVTPAFRAQFGLKYEF